MAPCANASLIPRTHHLLPVPLAVYMVAFAVAASLTQLIALADALVSSIVVGVLLTSEVALAMWFVAPTPQSWAGCGASDGLLDGRQHQRTI